MSIFTNSERRFLDAVSSLVYCNPFLPERIECEKTALGSAYTDGALPWNVDPEHAELHPNVVSLMDMAETLAASVRTRLKGESPMGTADRRRFEDLVLFLLYHRFRPRFIEVIHDMERKDPHIQHRISFYRDFVEEARRLLDLPGSAIMAEQDLPHLFACFFQIRRAFDQIFSCIIGISKATVRLRAQVWQSIFTHDMRRFRRILYNRMGDMTTLVTGPSGTGKELVARAIGLSRYIPFDAHNHRFTENFPGAFHPLNLSAMSPTLIESELFGHCRGSFTGALDDHAGWLESCSPTGAVFLDEIGELDMSIQVKILRVLQNRTFQRIGETATLTFKGKIIASTNRDLAADMQAGRFRVDLYYRLCSDIITTPALRDRLNDDPAELHQLTLHIVQRLLGESDTKLAHEIETWIDDHLGANYAWPGNVRELEQCIRNVMVRGEYQPVQTTTALAQNAREAITQDFRDGKLSADEMQRSYCTLVYAESGSYLETARRLGVDRRTVRSRIDRELIDALRG